MAGEQAPSFITIRDNCCQNWWLSCDHGGSQLEKKRWHMEESRAETLEKRNGDYPTSGFLLCVTISLLIAYASVSGVICYLELKISWEDPLEAIGWTPDQERRKYAFEYVVFLNVNSDHKDSIFLLRPSWEVRHLWNSCEVKTIFTTNNL